MAFPQVEVAFRPGAGPFYDPDDPGALVLPGKQLAWASTPDTAALDITGDIDLRADVTLDDWLQGYAAFIAKWTNAGDQRSWTFALAPAGHLYFSWSSLGTSASTLAATSTVPVTPGAGGRLAVRVGIDVNNGSGGRTITFYTAPTSAGPWSTLGAVVTTAGTTSLYNGSAPVGIGNYNGGVASGIFRPLRGTVHRAVVIQGLAGTNVRADVDFSGHAAGTTSVVDAEGLTWTVHGDAEVGEGRDFPWVDLSARALSASWSYGRSNELDTFAAGDAEVVLKNEDRHLDPECEDGPWYGLLEPRTPVRIRARQDPLSPWEDMFYGFVAGGFEQTYTPPAGATCTLRLDDMLAVLEGEVLPEDAYAVEVLADAPAAWWRLDSVTGNEMTDSSGNGAHGRFGEVALEDALIEGGGRAARFEHVGDWRGEATATALPAAAPATLEAWVRLPRDLTQSHSILVAQRDYAFGSGLWLLVGTAADSPNGQVVLYFFGLGSFLKVRGSTRIDDDEPHHVVAVIGGTALADIALYVDGSPEALTVLSGAAGGTWADHRIWTVGNTVDSGAGDFGLGGVLDEAAVYRSALSAARVAAHYEAGAGAHAGERSGVRVSRVLDIVGVPVTLRQVSIGDTSVGPADYAAQSAGAYLDRIAESEQGALYVDHHSGGRVTFEGRYHRLTFGRSTLAQWAFTDEDDPAALHVEAGSLDVKPNGIDSIINVASVSWADGTVVARDELSIARYGPQSRSLATEAPASSAALGAGQWLINRYARPQARVQGWALAPDADARLWPAVLDLRISDRVSLRRHPQQVGDPITNELYIERVEHEVTDGVHWRTSVATSHADPPDVAWIWGVSRWGQTTTWG